ncbi:MAG: radical SAM protein [Sphingobacteriales bacterium]|nr:radical SAM protein [Sphingobacteriales bacterium]
MKYKYLFGPVASRRLGLSLGIDLVPYKVCDLDCLYCESGKTTVKTTERIPYFPREEIIKELDDFFSSNPLVDFLTFSGAGEPLLNTDFHEISAYLNQYYPFFNTALITNGTLFYLPEVRKEVEFIDIVLPSLDSATQATFEKLNRPHPNLHLNQIVDGLIQLRKEFEGYIWLEIFIVEGINDTESELEAFRTILEKIRPDKIQLNSLDRPGTDKSIKTASFGRLEEIKSFFQPWETEIISRKYKTGHPKFKTSHAEELILETLKRRPCTENDLFVMTALSKEMLTNILEKLTRENKIISSVVGTNTFYEINQIS